MKRLCFLVLMALVLSISAQAGRYEVMLLDPAQPLAKSWQKQAFGIGTAYMNIVLDGQPAIRATGQGAAAGLFREISFSVRDYPRLKWRWRVDDLPAGADIRRKDKDDVGAALFLLFGKPGLFRPEPQTLAYSWTAASTAPGTVVISPYHPGSVRSIVIESGAAKLGRWVEEERDILADFIHAFGHAPKGPVQVIAIWSDSDQTNDRVSAAFGWIKALSLRKAQAR